ncbi:hypothetical protein BVRB_7g172620 [Beta vulgaris subsp. vulgaris]|nr:hypothetical protein BVRB_7g172620 [Beta vulgaris subsp. vulgaris]
MTELRTEDILREKKTHDADSITSISLNHKSLSYVISCLGDFKNLERLDLNSNSLTSLKGLEPCFNLKWLSVQLNKLHSLKGIEGLTNLYVVNAGKNKLRSMDEVKNLVNLRALILNDNEIVSISGLDQLMELNTLVLSRNPIRKLGNSLAKMKSIAKISLSNCQLEDIDSSIKACAGLEQLRLAHNDIKALPAELAFAKKLQILDLGSNMISRWSDLKVLSSLYNLRNINLLGNPIAENVKLVKKVKRLVPSLQILNSKRMDKLGSEKDQKAEDPELSLGDELKPSKKRRDHDVKAVERNANVIDEEEYQVGDKRDHVKQEKNSRKAKTRQVTEGEPAIQCDDGESMQKKRKKKMENHLEKEVLLQEADKTTKDKRSKRKAEKAHLDVIDDKETPFAELVAYDATESMEPNDGNRRDSQAVGKFDAYSPLVIYPAKKKKSKNQGAGASVLQFLMPEVGLGGQSAWADDD